MADLPPLGDDGELPFEAEYEKPKKRPPSRLWQKAYIPIPLLLAICALLICSAVLLLSSTFSRGSPLCSFTSLCTSADNLIEHAVISYDPRPPLDEPSSSVILIGNSTPFSVTVTPALYSEPRCDLNADYSNSIMFTSGSASNSEIFVTNLTGTKICRATNNSIDEQSVDWSPDRKHILFIAQRSGDSQTDLYVMDFDGSQIVNLTRDRFNESRASWSPDGTKIAFDSNADGGANVYVINADGSNRQAVTSDNIIALNPAWSPDGAQIVFTYAVGEPEIDTVDLKTLQVTSLVQRRFMDNVVWSPDGTSLLALHIDNLDSDIAQFKFATHEIDQLVQGSAVRAPIWSPDGKQIAFASGQALQIFDVATKAVSTIPTDGLPVNMPTSWR